MNAASAGLRRHDPAQGVKRPVLERFHRAFAAAEDAGDRAVVEAFDELEDDHLPLLLRQVLEGELELSAVEGAFGEGLGADLNGGKGLREVNLAAATAAAVEVYQLVAGDAEHPGGERHTPELVLVDGLQELEHHFGGQVFSGLNVAEVEEGVVVDPR